MTWYSPTGEQREQVTMKNEITFQGNNLKHANIKRRGVCLVGSPKQTQLQDFR